MLLSVDHFQCMGIALQTERYSTALATNLIDHWIGIVAIEGSSATGLRDGGLGGVVIRKAAV